MGFEDILGMWRNSPAKGTHLVLVMDCCHSGAWVEKAQAQWNPPDKHGGDLIHMRDGSAVMICACKQTEVALEDAQGGRLTQALVDSVNGDGMLAGVLGNDSKQHVQ